MSSNNDLLITQHARASFFASFFWQMIFSAEARAVAVAGDDNQWAFFVCQMQWMSSKEDWQQVNQ